MIQEMEFDIIQMNRRSAAFFYNDARACYDRIPPNFGMLVSRHNGLHRKVARLCGTTLESNQYQLQTGLGTTDTYYQHNKTSPVYGTGQGSAFSPFVWCLISSVLM